MRIGIPSETMAGERRVAMAPGVVGLLTKAGLEVHVQRGAGDAAGFADAAYEAAGARIALDRAAVFAADALLQVNTHAANPAGADLADYRPGQIVIGHADPLTAHDATRAIAHKGVTLFAVELVPRITRSQVMDALSSQANIAGYKGVLMAANVLAKMFPMSMTAAGTIKPAKVFVIGAGVAGLQAIATAKRLGAVVSAIDVRPAVKEQVESLGAKFVMPPSMAEGSGGYAKEMTDDQKAEQQRMMADTIADSDVVVTTAAIPGRPSPKLIAADVVERMRPGSVVVDLASERGGNCALTRPGETYTTDRGVTIIGEVNVAAKVPHDASAMYARNVAALLLSIVKDGAVHIDTADEVVAGTLVCRDGQVVHPQVRKAMGLGELNAAKPQAAEGGQTP